MNHGSNTDQESGLEDEKDGSPSIYHTDSASNRDSERSRTSIEFREQVDMLGSSSDSSSASSSSYSSEESEMEDDEAGSG